MKLLPACVAVALTSLSVPPGVRAADFPAPAEGTVAHSIAAVVGSGSLVSATQSRASGRGRSTAMSLRNSPGRTPARGRVGHERLRAQPQPGESSA